MTILDKVLSIKQKESHTIFTIFGLRIALRYFFIFQFYLCCDIEDLNYIKKQRVHFTHPIGIVINRDVRVGKGCVIRQNVTIGRGKYNEERGRAVPYLGNNVQIGANFVIIG